MSDVEGDDLFEDANMRNACAWCLALVLLSPVVACAQGGPMVTPPVDLSSYVAPFVGAVAGTLSAVVVAWLGLVAMRRVFSYFSVVGGAAGGADQWAAGQSLTARLQDLDARRESGLRSHAAGMRARGVQGVRPDSAVFPSGGPRDAIDQHSYNVMSGGRGRRSQRRLWRRRFVV